MQYNHKVTIEFVTKSDEYGQPETTTSKEMRCCILSENIVNLKTDSKRKNQFDLELLVSAKTYEPYSKLFDDNEIMITSSGRKYDPQRVAKINGTGGKAKYYQISFIQVRK